MSVYQYDVVLNYDTSKADASLGAFRARVVAQLGDLSSKLSKIELFKDAQVDAKAAQQSVGELSTRVNELKRILAGLSQGDAGFRELQTQAKAATAEISAMGREISSGEKKFSKLNDEAGRLKDALQPAYARVAQLRSAFDGLEKGDAAFKDVSAALRVAERDFANTEKAIARNQQKMSDLAVSLQAARVKVDEMKAAQITLGEALKKAEAGSVGYKTLSDNLKIAEKELRAAEKSAALTADRMAALDVELKSAGIDTKALAAEQIALSKGLEAVRRESAIQTARQTLGVVGADEARGQIAKLTEAYNVLRVSGTASVNELATAKAALDRKINEVNASMTGLTGSTSAFSVAALAAALGAGGIASALTSAVKSAIDYEQGVARISSITNLNRVQLDEMGRQVVQLSRSIGLDLPNAFNALYEIVSSGVPTENAIKVLEISAKAAVAGVASVNDASKLGVAIINAYGLQIGELGRVFDIVFQTVKDGVVTLPELSEKLGLVLPAAKNAGVALEEISGAIVVLTRAGLNAPRTMVALEGAIKQLSAPTTEAAAAMVELGISYNGFLGTIQQIAAKNLSTDVLRRLIPDVEGQRAVATLARNYSLLSESVDTARSSAGAANEAFLKLAGTPKQELDKFKATVESLKIAIGDGLLASIQAGLPVMDAMTGKWAEWERSGVGPVTAAVRALVPDLALMGDMFSRQREVMSLLAPALSRAGVEYAAVASNVQALDGKLLSLSQTAQQSAQVAVAAIARYGEAIGPLATDVGQRLSLLDNQVRSAESALATLEARLKASADSAKSLFDQSAQSSAQQLQRVITETEQAVARRQIGEIEGMKRVEAARADSYKTQLGLLNDYSGKALLAYDAEAAARLAIAKKTGADLQKVEIELRDGRLAVLNDLRNKYSQIATEAAQNELRQVQAVRDAEDEKRRLREASANFTRELRVVAFGEEIKQLRSQLSEANEYRLQAERAAQAGRAAQAEEYLKKAYDLEKSAAKRAAEIKVSEEKKAADEIASQDAKSADERIKTATESAAKIAKANSAATDAAAVLRSATTDLQSTEKQLEAAITARAEAAKKAGESYADVAKSAKAALDDVLAQIKAANDSQLGNVTIRLVADAKATDDQIKNLQTYLDARAPVAEVKLLVDAAIQQSQKLKDDIEKGKPQVQIEADYTKLKADTAALIKALPAVGLQADDKAVREALKGLEAPIADVSKKRIELQSNVDEITAKLVALNKIELKEKELTVNVKYVGGAGAATGGVGSGLPGFAGGGPVGARAGAAIAGIRGYASGGFVGTVPGVGNSDSVFKLLNSKSFVLNKAATQALARALRGGGAGGGFNGSTIDAWQASIQGADSFARGGMIASMFNAGLAAMDRNIAAYRANTPAGFVEPNAERVSREYAAPEIAKRLSYYNAAVGKRDQGAADAASNYAIDYAKILFGPLGGIDGKSIYDQIKALRGDAYVKARGGNLDAADLPGAGGYAGGGVVAGGGIVPAMLTPGEIVFSPSAVQSIGLTQLMALNASRNAARSAAILASARAFADGGYVQDGPTLAGSVAAFARRALGSSVVNNSPVSNVTNNATNNFTINAGSDVSAKQLVRMIGDEIDARARRKR